MKNVADWPAASLGKGGPDGAERWVCFIRHAQASHNVPGEQFVGEPELTPFGEQQCKAAQCDWAGNLFRGADIIVTSPLLRALQTAIILNGQKAAADPRLLVTPLCTERRDGHVGVVNRGTSKSELLERMPLLESWQGFAQLQEEWWPAEREDVPGRVSRFLAWLRGRRERRTVVISHGGLLSWILQRELKNLEHGMVKVSALQEPMEIVPSPCNLQHSRGVSLHFKWQRKLGTKKWQTSSCNDDTLFLLMGYGADLRKTLMNMYLSKCAQYFDVLTYEHRNTGQADVQEDKLCSIAAYADDAAALLEAVAPQRLPIFVMGIAFGGTVAQHLALRHPHLVKKLVLCACGAGGSLGSPYNMQGWYEESVPIENRAAQIIMKANISRTEAWRLENPKAWNLAYDMVLRDESLNTASVLRGIRRQLAVQQEHDLSEVLHQLKMPVLCCGSPQDGICPPDVIRHLAACIGDGCSLHAEFDGGHVFLWVDATALSKIADWLRAAAVQEE